MVGIEFFDVASKCSTWHRTFRRGIELFDVASKCSMFDIVKEVGSDSLLVPPLSPLSRSEG